MDLLLSILRRHFAGNQLQRREISTVFSLPLTWEEREKVILAMKIIVAGLKIREIHEEYVINSLQPVITITQRKDIRYCIFINMFLRRENIKRINIFQHFLHVLSRARFNLPLVSCPDLSRPEWDLGTRLKLTPPSFTALD